MKPRVIIADDHPVVLEGLQWLLADHVDLIGTAKDGGALIDLALRLKPDLIILDISMPVLNGIKAARRLRHELPDTKLIFLTMHADLPYATEALRMGVSGYVLKSSALSDLLAAIESVQKGGTYVSPQLKLPAESQESRKFT